MEDALKSEEDIENRHRQQRKDLQSKIQALKKSVPKGDKKKKKQIQDEITNLEHELSKQQAEETCLPLIEPKSEQPLEPPPQTNDETVNEDSPHVRTSRAAKRRNKKAQDEREREGRIREQAEKNKDGPRVQEMNAIKDNLKTLGLELFSIPADGNCLYCAINHQLGLNGKQTFSVSKLRKITSDFIRDNKDDFLPFMYNESDEAVSEEYFEAYCKEVANTKLWGGQLELRALSNILQSPIKVIQANGPPTVQGESFIGPELILAYHRHLYRLGEHYNSTTIEGGAAVEPNEIDSN